MRIVALSVATALTGIAVNSAIVLIDAAKRRRRQRMTVLHAAVYAARKRAVPIVITCTTTIAGLFSLVFRLGGKSLIWGPVAACPLSRRGGSYGSTRPRRIVTRLKQY